MKKPLVLTVFLLFCTCVSLTAQSHKIWWGYNFGGALWTGGIHSYNSVTDILTEEYSFKREFIGRYPTGGALTVGSDSCLYGTTIMGGLGNAQTNGNIFKYDPRDSSYNNLYFFGSGNGSPYNGLYLDSNLNAFGVCLSFIYKLNTITKALTVIHSWNSATGDTPQSGMMMASNGLFYGVTQHGGANGGGVLYSVDTTINAYSVLHDFTGNNPLFPPIEYSPGVLIGVTPFGGVDLVGEIYKYEVSTGLYSTLYSFLLDTCSEPNTPIIKGSDGKLYGTTYFDGASNGGTLFRFNITNNLFEILHNFTTVGAIGFRPCGNLFEDSIGVFYGVTRTGGGSAGTIFKFNVNASSINAVHAFDPYSEGIGTSTEFTKYYDGRLFAYNSYGFTSGDAFEGAVYSIDPTTNTFQLAFDFEQTPEGTNPYGDLYAAADGNVYGINLYGSTAPTFFKYDSGNDTLIILKRFSDIGYNYSAPASAIGTEVVEINNMLYGSILSCDSFPFGAYYTYNLLSGQFQIQVSFDTIASVKFPSSLKVGVDGNLYGLAIKKLTGSTDKYVLRINPVNLTIDTLFQYASNTSYYSDEELLFNITKSKLTFMRFIGGAINKGQIFVYDILTNNIIYTHDIDSMLIGTNTALLINDSTLICVNHYVNSINGGFIYKVDMNTSLISVLYTFPTTLARHYQNENFMSDGYIYGMYYTNQIDYLYKFDPITNSFTLLKSIPVQLGKSPGNRLQESSFLTGLNNEVKETAFAYLYPNPCSSFINIKNTKENNSIKIYDVFGKLIHTLKTNHEITRVETVKLIPGMYLIHYIENKKIHVMKMVKI